MTDMLVGYTGFVGSNLDQKHAFTYRINTKNSDAAVAKRPDLLVYAGVRAEKFLANNNPQKDYENIVDAFEHIKAIEPKKLVLISTVDVYLNPLNVDEDTVIETENLQAYGLNRYKLECMVRETYPDALIVRLPGLFGMNIKKNFIYDYINVIPSMLNVSKYEELSKQSECIKLSYQLQDNGFYKCKLASEELKTAFKKIGFSALNFTDSRGIFQFYNLSHLWDDIQTAIKNNLKLLNITTEPVSVSEVYRYLSGNEFINEVANIVPHYDFKSLHAEIFGGRDGYFYGKSQVLQEIKAFVDNYENISF